ncbi:MAG: hypothetical protein ABI702_02030 [Burkholderiales bacterium]
MTNAALSPDLLYKLDAYWRAANYLSVGQIYLYDNPLLKTPLFSRFTVDRVIGIVNSPGARAAVKPKVKPAARSEQVTTAKIRRWLDRFCQGWSDTGNQSAATPERLRLAITDLTYAWVSG